MRKHIELSAKIFTIFLLTAHAAWAEFVTLPAGNNPYPNVVAIGIPPNCNSTETQYGKQLEATLQSYHVPVREISQMAYHFSNAGERAQIQQVMQAQPAPQVFINGRMMGHPSFDDIVAELRLQHTQQ